MRIAPAPVADADARQMHDGIDTLEGADVDLPRGRIPVGLARLRLAPHEPVDLVASRLERLREGGPDQPVRPGDDDPHGWQPSPDLSSCSNPGLL